MNMIENEISGIADLTFDPVAILLSSFNVTHMYGNVICLDVPMS
jgi:hypothetical protein